MARKRQIKSVLENSTEENSSDSLVTRATEEEKEDTSEITNNFEYIVPMDISVKYHHFIYGNVITRKFKKGDLVSNFGLIELIKKQIKDK